MLGFGVLGRVGDDTFIEIMFKQHGTTITPAVGVVPVRSPKP